MFIDKEEIIELYKSGMSMKEVSKKLGHNGINKRVFTIIKSSGLSRAQGFQKGHHLYRNQTGENNHKWKGGIKIEHGYRKVLIGKNKYIPEQDYVWIKENKIPIPNNFVIHHRDGDKLNNKIENLCLLPRDFHSHLHWEYEKVNGINRFGGKE